MTTSRPNIYIVDDDSSVCRSLALLLKTHDFHVQTFTCAKDFLAAKPRYGISCLILDLCLPTMNGLELQQVMAAKGLTVPIIFISGQGNIPKNMQAMTGGAADFLLKPFTDKELLDAIDQAIAKDKITQKDLAEKEKI